MSPLPRTASPIHDARLYAQQALEALRLHGGFPPDPADVAEARHAVAACIARLDEAVRMDGEVERLLVSHLRLLEAVVEETRCLPDVRRRILEACA